MMTQFSKFVDTSLVQVMPWIVLPFFENILLSTCVHLCKILLLVFLLCANSSCCYLWGLEQLVSDITLSWVLLFVTFLQGHVLYLCSFCWLKQHWTCTMSVFSLENMHWQSSLLLVRFSLFYDPFFVVFILIICIFPRLFVPDTHIAF